MIPWGGFGNTWDKEEKLYNALCYKEVATGRELLYKYISGTDEEAQKQADLLNSMQDERVYFINKQPMMEG